jgi:hypothetical protein
MESLSKLFSKFYHLEQGHPDSKYRLGGEGTIYQILVVLLATNFATVTTVIEIFAVKLVFSV